MRPVALRATVALALLAGHACLLAESLNGTPAGPADPNEAIAAWGKCAGKAQSDDTCRALRYRVLQIVSEDIFTLAASERPQDHALVVGMLQRPELELRLAAADALGMRGAAPGDVPALIEALNDSVPLMRKKVGRAIPTSAGATARAVVERLVPASDSRVPDTPTDVSKLGVRPYAGASYNYFSSAPDEGRAEFMTGDPPAKVIDFYKAAAKKPPMALAEFGRVYGATAKPMQDLSSMSRSGQLTPELMAQMTEMAQQMAREMEGKSPEEIQRAMTEGATAVGTKLPIERYSDTGTYGAARVVVLNEVVHMGATRPSLYLVVFEDVALGKTGIAVHFIPAR